jgi:DNA-binding transcriptional LysR family regulator
MANNHNQPSLDDLAVFLAVRTSGGFRAAATQLGLAPSNISDTISRLESQLGVPLLLRTTRSMTLTEAGKELAERIAPLLAETRAALHDAASSQQHVRGVLRLNVPGAVMPDILPPLLDRFLAEHPGVRVDIVLEDRLVDAIAAGCDAGIRYGEHLSQDMIAIPLGPPMQQLAVAAAPAYFAARSMPSHPHDLIEHECIRLKFSSGALVKWELEKAGEALVVDPPARVTMHVDAVASAIDLACRGHGMILTFRNWLDPYLEKGELQPVLQDWWPQFEGPKLYFSRRLTPAPLRAFIDLITRERAC